MCANIFIGHHQFGLRVVGSWPGKSQLPGFYFAIGIMLFFLIFEILNITEVYHDLEELMDNLVSTIGVVLGLFKFITVRVKRRKLKTVINKIFNDWKTDRQFVSEMMVENCTRSQLVSKFVIFLYNSMNFTYFLRTVISRIFDEVQDRKFLAQVTFPIIDGRQTPLYEIIIFFQFVTASVCFNSQALVEGLLATLVLHACSKVDVVRREILNFSTFCKTDKNDKKDIIKTLSKLSEEHLKFVEFSEDIQDIFSYVSFFHIFFLTLIQVVSGNPSLYEDLPKQFLRINSVVSADVPRKRPILRVTTRQNYQWYTVVLTEQSLRWQNERGTKPVNLIHYAILTISFLVSAGYYCIAGEYLTSQSEIIFNELYNCYWYEYSSSYKKAICFMLLKARKPVKLTVGKFSTLSLIYLTSIMKTSFSYLSLVRAPHRIGLKMIGVWPGVTGWSGFAFIMGWLFFTLIFMIWDVFIIYHDLELLMNNLLNTVGIVMGLLKILTFRVKRRNIEFMINTILDDWLVENNETANGIMPKNLSRSELLCKMLLISYNCMNVTYITKTLFSYLFDEVKDRQFLAQSSYPIDARVSPMYEIVFAEQIIAAILCVNSHALIESFLGVLALHACIKMDSVRREIINYSNICRVQQHDKRLALMTLRKLWHKHLQFIEFAENIPNVFSYISFFNIAFIVLIQVICIFIFMNMIENEELSIHSIHCIACNVSCLLSSGYYCVIGEYLTYQSELILNYLYECPWYEFEASDVKILTFMLMRARKLIHLKFGKFNDLSLEFLTTVSMQYFTYTLKSHYKQIILLFRYTKLPIMSAKIVMRHVQLGLQVIGLWPGYTSSVGFFITILLLLTCLAFQLWHAAIVFSKLDALMGNLGATLAVATAILKLIAFHSKGRNVIIVINEILNDWTIENRFSNCEVMIKNTKRAKHLTKWITGACNGTVITYLVSAIIAYSSGVVEKRLYVLPSKFPLYCKQSPVFEVVCFFQFAIAVISANAHALIEGVLTVLVLHAGTKVHLLEREIQKFSVICQSKTNKEITSKATRGLIDKHLNFIKFVKEVKDIYYFVSFVHVFTFTFLHVIVGYMFIDALESGDRSIKLFLYGLFTIRALASTTIYCIAGEYLMNQSMRIYGELYNTAWYDFDVKNIKAVTFMIMKARNATSLTSASFGQLSLFYLTGTNSNLANSKKIMSDKIVMRHVRVGLQVIGLWPGYTSSVGFVIAITWLLTCLTFQLWHAAVVFSKLDALMDNLGGTVAVATATLKLIAFHAKGRNVKIVIKEILNDWAYENRSSNCEVMVQNTKRAKYLTKWITGAYNATVITYLVNAIIAYCSGITEQRLYVMPSKFPFFCKQSPVFEIVCFFQLSAALISTNVQALVEGMLTALTLERGDRSIKLFLYGLFTTRALASTTIYCIAGEYLMNQSMRIFDELYNSAWYEFDVPNIKAITFMIMKARKATSLTPASFGQLSLFYLTSDRTQRSFIAIHHHKTKYTMSILSRHVRIGLYAIDAWPGVSSSGLYFLVMAYMTFSLIFQILNTTEVITQLDLLMNNLQTTMPVILVVLKLFVFRVKCRSARLLIADMLSDWKCINETKERKVMMKNAKIAFHLSSTIAICYNGLILSYLLKAILAYKTENIYDRKYVMQATFPINAKRSPVFEMLCLFQFTVSVFAANGHAILEGLLTTSVLHANTKAFGVCQEITKFAESCEANKSRKNIVEAKRRLIKRHLYFINFAEKIQETYAYISFFNLFLMTLINCIVGYMFINLTIKKDNISSLLLCIAYMFTALSAGSLIFEKLYDCPWYKFKPVDTKTFIIMLMKSRHSVTITAGNFGDLSLVYFTKSIKHLL
ncbi:hypothetical protein TSAR_010114 [Trichomalopsis sarcophagae]|uniref:Odorant receptor n=1 Tax=Trichomalopsis sarcophagae TaxID=543379 RepID=A0A232FK69_9HYME|nr:hypothetical protein TSAR_010114 [Trichomalopsis sarcophagae]